MNMTLVFWFSFSLFLVGCVVSRILAAVKKTGLLNSFNAFFAAVFTSAWVLQLPVVLNEYLNSYDTQPWRAIKYFLLSVFNTLKLFIVDGEFESVIAVVSEDDGWVYYGITVLSAALFVIAPILTFGFVLTFFKNTSAHLRYLFHHFADVYVVSELNEKSIALVEDIIKNEKVKKKECKTAQKLVEVNKEDKFRKRLIVFTDVYDNNEEGFSELIERARKVGAILFKKDITAVNFSFHSFNSKINFIVTGANESENLSHVLALGKKYKKRANTYIYTFSTDVSTELLINRMDKGEIKVRRIKEVQSLINRNIFDYGYQKIFAPAIPQPDGTKKINAVIVGMGLHGTEMTKTLAWVGQMDGYTLKITSFDKDPLADSKFKALCPGLMDTGKFGSIFDADIYNASAPCFELSVHKATDVASQEFYDELDKLGDISYVFISLGSDEMNIKTAIDIRTYLLRNGKMPVIDTVVYNSDKKASLHGIANYSNQPYEINFIGDLKSSYCEAVVMKTDIEKLALERHKKWGTEDTFWSHEYNYRSSVAAAIHRKLKIECEVPGYVRQIYSQQLGKKTPLHASAQIEALRRLEHRRWNVYMLSEGFVYNKKRNNLAKTHNLIVPFDNLPDKEKEKDDY